MPSTTIYNRGDVVLVPFPFTDLSSRKRRPALVISPDSFNQIGDDLILAAITSQLSPAPHTIDVLPADCVEGALPKKSLIKLTKVFTISASLVLKKFCRLNDPKLAEVLTGLRTLYS